MIVIYIQNVTGKTFKVGVELQYTMRRVKELIYENEGHPVEEQTLSLDGKQVKDDVLFTRYYMHAEMHFQLVVKGQQDMLQEIRRIRKIAQERKQK